LPLVQKRPARTPPSTFLFLPIHLSNSPEPCGSVVINRPPAICRSRRSPHIRHGQEPAGCSFHRENSEGLRRRAIAPKRRRRAKKGYIVFAPGCCQPFGRRKNALWIVHWAANFAGPNSVFRRPRSPHCGHIPPPFFALSYRGVAPRGKRRHLLRFQPWSLKLSALVT
jgi:hypothetical protein